MSPAAARVWCVRAAHLAVPFAIRYAATRRPPVASGRTPLDHYDLATGALALVTGRPGIAVGAGALAVGAGLAPEHVARVGALAAAEELVWRASPAGRAGTVAGVVGFALVHAPAAPRSWPYHLATGAVLTATARRWGVGAAVALHVGHNLAVGWSDRARERARAAETGVPAGPALPGADAWPPLERVS